MVAPGSPADVAPPVVVPHTNRDPIRSLRPTSVAFSLQGRDFEIPALPAADWLEVFMDPNWMAEDIMIALVPGGHEVLRLIDPVDLDDLGLDILETVSARHWWIADRLIGVIGASWDAIGAEAILHQLDPERLSLAAWLDAMLLLLMRRVDPNQAAMFTARLESPPPGEELEPEEMTMSAEQFMAMGSD